MPPKVSQRVLGLIGPLEIETYFEQGWKITGTSEIDFNGSPRTIQEFQKLVREDRKQYPQAQLVVTDTNPKDYFHLRAPIRPVIIKLVYLGR